MAGPGSGDDDTDLDDGVLLMQAGLGLASVQATSPASQQPYRFLGNELYSDSCLGLYDFHARLYDPALGRFLAPDPLAGKYPELSPYVYCGGSPVVYRDVDGRETHVVLTADGNYKVIGGVLNEDTNVYVYLQDLDGNYTIRGESIGITTSTTSFYNADANDGGAWAVGSIVDLHNERGREFLKRIFEDTPTMIDDYMVNAVNGGKYDFKSTDGNIECTERLDPYRGMPIEYTKDGLIVITSARDIGNIAAGYIAGSNNIPWIVSRIAFDTFQSQVSGHLTTESISTRNAELYGWNIGSNLKRRDKVSNLIKSLKSWFKQN